MLMPWNIIFLWYLLAHNHNFLPQTWNWTPFRQIPIRFLIDFLDIKSYNLYDRKKFTINSIHDVLGAREKGKLHIL